MARGADPPSPAGPARPVPALPASPECRAHPLEFFGFIRRESEGSTRPSPQAVAAGHYAGLSCRNRLGFVTVMRQSSAMSNRPLSETLHIYRSAEIQERDDSCFAITPKLVSGERLSATQQKMVNNLDGAIASTSPTDAPMVLYRGCAPTELVSEQPYLSFLSVSSDALEALRFHRGCLVRIDLPVASRILQVSPGDRTVATLESNEYLLPRGMAFLFEEWIPEEEEQMRIRFAAPNERLTLVRALVRDVG